MNNAIYKSPPVVTNTKRAITVIVAEDDASLRSALADLISAEPGFRMLGAGSNADEAIALAVANRPDVALLDVKMPGGGGLRAAEEIRAQSPTTQVVALSAYGDRDTVFRMLGAGAVGYLVKGAGGDQIIDALRRAVTGTSTIAPEIAGEVIGEIAEYIERERIAVVRRTAELERLHRALRSDGFHMVYQPVRELSSGRCVGVEALSRFTLDPQRGPREWFAEAEANGVRIELELLAMRTALASSASRSEDFFVAVNLSTSTLLSEALPEQLPDQMAGIVIEISETAATDDYAQLHDLLDEIRRRGGVIAIDNVGAGYATLRHILRLAPAYIKLDMDLARHIASDRRIRALAVGLVAFAIEIDAAIIAEGIETEVERQALAGVGVSHGQGFHLGVPGPWPVLRMQSI